MNTFLDEKSNGNCTDDYKSVVERIGYPVDLKGLSLKQWVAENRETLLAKIEHQGVVLLRGLNIISSTQFGKISEILFGDELADYSNRSTPRTELKGKVFTTTEYPAEETIPLHNENAYSHEWVMKAAFFCLVPPPVGGETPVADSRKIYQKIPSYIRDKFEEKGVMYLRNYGSVGLPWQDVFQVETKQEVDDYCRLHNIEFSWRPDGSLRTWQICPAVQVHPVTGEKVWFNQAHLFHVSNHSAQNREALMETFSEDQLPRHAYYGDGQPIEEEYLAIIRQIYLDEKIKFQWQRGDLLIADNMLFCHGRESFEGARRIILAMAGHNSLTKQLQIEGKS